jgi:PKD repeat protein
MTLSSCDKSPVACISMDQASVSVGTPIQFTSCSEKSLSYVWSFEGPAGAPENSLQWAETTFSRAFTISGTYTVTLTAYQKYSWVGESSVATETVTIN